MGTASRKPGWYLHRLHEVDDDFIGRVVKEVERGATVKQVARIMQVPAFTFQSWLATGAEQLHQAYEEGREGPAITPEASLFVAVEQALGERAVELVGAITKATKDDEWRAKAWLLERLERDEFGDVKQVELSGPGKGAIQLETRGVSIAAVVEFAAQHGGLGAGDLDSLSETVARTRALLPAPSDDLETAGGVPSSPPG